MNNIFIYILILLLNVNSLFFQQLVKLPILFQHYAEHKVNDQEIGILDYLSMHYWGKDIDDSDSQRDNQLPFKSGACHTAPFAYILPQEIELLHLHGHGLLDKVICKMQYLASEAHFISPLRPPIL